MEFLQQAEKAQFSHLADRDPLVRNNPKSIHQLLGDPLFRERLIKKAKTLNELLVFNINFDGNPHDNQKGLQVEISVRNKGVVGHQRRADSFQKRRKALIVGSLEEFLQEQTMDEDLQNAGLLNLHALKGLCADQNIVMETSLSRDEISGETIATMRFIL
jgi:hypothetical protein